MRTISENFKLIIKKQREIGYYFPSILRPPADLETIHQAEKKLGFEFNEELTELYLCADGTYPYCGMPSGKTGLIPIHTFMSLSTAIDYYKEVINFENWFTMWNTSYEPEKKVFPFLNDDGNCYWVDLNKGSEHYGKIYWTNTYPSSPDYAFTSLTSMFQTIAECYEKDFFFLDEDGFLNEDVRWAITAKKYNPTLEYWDEYLNGT